MNGVQGSLCAACEMLSFVAGLLLHRPQQFRLLMLGSCACVAAAAALLARYALAAAAEAAAEGVDAAGAELQALLVDADDAAPAG